MKKYSPYEICAYISYTDQRSRATGVVQTHQKPGFVRSLVKRAGTVAYISNQVGDASAVQYGLTHFTESYEDTIIITSLTRSQGGAHGRGGALWRDFTVHDHWLMVLVALDTADFCSLSTLCHCDHLSA